MGNGVVEGMKGKKIEIKGKPDNEVGILEPWNVHLLEDGEVVPRVQKFEFSVDASKGSRSGAALVTITQYPEIVDFELEGVEVHKELVNTRLFNECTEIMKTMDYDFRLHIQKKGISWKTEDPVTLKEYLDKCYESLNTIMEQYKKGDRSIIDITLFATKLANYAVLLADRTHSIHLEEKEEREGEGCPQGAFRGVDDGIKDNGSGDSVQNA